MNLSRKIVFQSLRWLEGVLPQRLLFILLQWLCRLSLLIRHEKDIPGVNEFQKLHLLDPAIQLPDEAAQRDEQLLNRMDRIAACWPDRFHLPRWQHRCEVKGIAPLLELNRARRPVILVTFHVGPLFNLRYWLRSMELPVAGLVGERTDERSAFRIWTDRLEGRPWPNAFSTATDLLKAMRWLRKGAMLLAAVDLGDAFPGPVVAMGEGRIRLNSGLIRMAIRSNAVIVPVFISRPRAMSCEIRFAAPIEPRDNVTEFEGHVLASMAETALLLIRKHPAQVGPEFLGCIVDAKPNNAAP